MSSFFNSNATRPCQRPRWLKGPASTPLTLVWVCLLSTYGPVSEASAATDGPAPTFKLERQTLTPQREQQAAPSSRKRAAATTQAAEAVAAEDIPTAPTTLSIQRSKPQTAPLYPLIKDAHAAYSSGNFPLAEQLYQQVLRADPVQADALNGLGAIAFVQHQPATAAAFFRRALLARPHDPVASANLSRLLDPNSEHASSRFKSQLAERPASPDSLVAQIALAENFARQQRWAESQQAWFQAHHRAPDDPDIAYNLAVSLDHLAQHNLAANFYQRALHLATQQPQARFPREACQARLQTLRPDR